MTLDIEIRVQRLLVDLKKIMVKHIRKGNTDYVESIRESIEWLQHYQKYPYGYGEDITSTI